MKPKGKVASAAFPFLCLAASASLPRVAKTPGLRGGNSSPAWQGLRREPTADREKARAVRPSGGRFREKGKKLQLETIFLHIFLAEYK